MICIQIHHNSLHATEWPINDATEWPINGVTCRVMRITSFQKNKPLLETGNESNGYTKTKTMVSESDKKP